MKKIERIIIEGMLEKMSEYGIDQSLAPVVYDMILAKNDLLKKVVIDE